MLISLLQTILDGLAVTLKTIISILPNSPFSAYYSFAIDNTWLGLLAYIIPVQSILAVLQAWSLSVALFYVYMVILRWVKAIE